MFHPPVSSTHWLEASVLHHARFLPSLSIWAYHWSLLSVEKEQIRPRAPTASRGLHPTSNSQGVSPFKAIKKRLQNKPELLLGAKQFSDLVKIHFLRMWIIKWQQIAYIESPMWTNWMVQGWLLPQPLMGQTYKGAREKKGTGKKTPLCPVFHSLGK